MEIPVNQKKYRFNNIEPSSKALYVVIKIDEPMTHAPWRDVDCSGVVVKAQDLLTPSGRKTNKYFDDIKRAGGIHEFFSCDADVIVSTIMPDRMIFGFSIEAYIEMIDALQPDYYYTPDGETYLTEEWVSRSEINRVFSDTQQLLRSFPHIKPIGLVKGCTLRQIDDHTHYLLRSGITRFVFHAGDYLCRGSSIAIDQAIAFACSIRQKVPWLLINGIGAMSSLKNFSYADGFVTQSHFVNAFYGQFCDQFRSNDEKRSISRNDIMNNLRNIRRNVSAIQLQKSLSEWMIIDGNDCFGQQNNALVNSGSFGSKGGN